MKPGPIKKTILIAVEADTDEWYNDALDEAVNDARNQPVGYSNRLSNPHWSARVLVQEYPQDI